MVSTAITVLSVILCLWAIWKKHRIQRQFSEYKIQIKQEREESPELELATTKQIVHELSKRSNVRFILLLPHGSRESEDLHVEIHSNNISLPMALGMLRATYQGVIDTLRPPTEGNEEDE
jgi:hypothetical protein